MTEPVRSGRETRLLALVIVIAIAALMLLARFRFSGADERPPVAPPPGPLDLLATRPPYHDLGSFISALAERIAPSFVVVETALVPPPANGRRARPAGAPTTSPVPIGQSMPTRLAALRVSSDRALLYLPANTRVITVAGAADKPDVVADAGREVALVRVPIAAEPSSPFAAGADPIPPFGYVAVIEAGLGGPTTRPVFIGRLDEVEDPSWSAPISVIGGATDVTPGALLFSLDGRFAGMAIRTPNGVAIVPKRALNPIVSGLLAPRSASALSNQRSASAVSNQRSASALSKPGPAAMPTGGGVRSRF